MNATKIDRRGKILFVDDISENRKLAEAYINSFSTHEVLTLSSGVQTVKILIEEQKYLPDVIVMDIRMPKLNGFETAAILKEHPNTQNIPIICITALNDTTSRLQALNAKAADLITKPFNKSELLMRIGNQLSLKFLMDELREKNRLLANREVHLLKIVDEKTDKIQSMTLALVNALENANLLNDEDTGNHILRVSTYSAMIADGLGMSRDFVKAIQLYASLHDVGKVGIADAILKKPGEYNQDEFATMKNHVDIGYKMLDNSALDSMAKNISGFHHEKWDGSGYNKGLAGDEIPIEARIVTIADVYDALGTQRVYKPAFDEGVCETILREGAEKHFDPGVLDTFFKIYSDIQDIKQQYS